MNSENDMKEGGRRDGNRGRLELLTMEVNRCIVYLLLL